METASPKALFDLYCLLPEERKCDFLRLLGQSSLAEAVILHMSNLSREQQHRFSDFMFREFIHLAFPFLLQEARRLAREQPELTDVQFEEELDDAVRVRMEAYGQVIGEREAAKLKEQRDRKSDPETIRRNVEICDLWKADPKKKWTQGRLAKHFKVTARFIRKVLKEEAKWRQLNASLGTN